MEVPDPRGKTALLHAVETNQLKCLQVLLDNGGKVRLYTRDGDTALHIAVNEGNAELLWPLLDHGADLEATDASGRTPLLAAILKGQLTIMNILVAAGANRDARFGPHPGQSPLEIVRGDIKKLSEMPKGKSRFQQLKLLEQMESSLSLSQPPKPALIIDNPRRLMAQPPPESPYALESCRGFQGLVVDFLPGRLKKNLEGRISVMNLLYGGGCPI
jgi:Ankyrin repeats (3 copies)